MREQYPQRRSPEAILRLQYPAGWQEIMTAPDAAEWRTWIESLAGLTQQRCAESGTPPEWAGDAEAVTSRWQRAIELVADASIDPADELTEAQRIETALQILNANLDGIGWEKEGLAFGVVHIITLEEAMIDLREIQSFPFAND